MIVDGDVSEVRDVGVGSAVNLLDCYRAECAEEFVAFLCMAVELCGAFEQVADEVDEDVCVCHFFAVLVEVGSDVDGLWILVLGEVGVDDGQGDVEVDDVLAFRSELMGVLVDAEWSFMDRFSCRLSDCEGQGVD